MSGKRWTEDEIEFLESMLGTHTVKTIAKMLGRSFDAVNIKLNRIGLSGFVKSTDRFTINQICSIFRVSWRTVDKKWKDHGLRILRKGNFKVVSQDDLIKFLKNNQDIWNAANMSDDWILSQYDWFVEKKKADTKTQYHWTSYEVSKLNYLRGKGYSCREIAERLGRTEASVKYKLYKDKNRKT